MDTRFLVYPSQPSSFVGKTETYGYVCQETSSFQTESREGVLADKPVLTREDFSSLGEGPMISEARFLPDQDNVTDLVVRTDNLTTLWKRMPTTPRQILL